MKKGKPEKYLPENQYWRKDDIFPNCNQKVIICPKCELQKENKWPENKQFIIPYGHLTTNLKQSDYRINGNGIKEIKLEYFIIHSHFTDLDKGRHIRCKLGYKYVPINSPNIKTIYIQSHRFVPEWIIDEMDEVYY